MRAELGDMQAVDADDARGALARGALGVAGSQLHRDRLHLRGSVGVELVGEQIDRRRAGPRRPTRLLALQRTSRTCTPGRSSRRENPAGDAHATSTPTRRGFEHPRTTADPARRPTMPPPVRSPRSSAQSSPDATYIKGKEPRIKMPLNCSDTPVSKSENTFSTNANVKPTDSIRSSASHMSS